ncbi:hypothetical protein FHU36_001168 [Nonomuraea muscovyensis]|uniref:Uncharacterized protein n=1 Tax=Nonomuraea muscovyensis TaxID=1124761 RepID=A0A7X0EWT5_9ACTN|nr:hypothetical protein [Nonomuraea muscovyensis]
MIPPKALNGSVTPEHRAILLPRVGHGGGSGPTRTPGRGPAPPGERGATSPPAFAALRRPPGSVSGGRRRAAAPALPAADERPERLQGTRAPGSALWACRHASAERDGMPRALERLSGRLLPTRRASGDTRAGRVGAVPWLPGSRAGPRRGARLACLNAGSCTRLEQDLGLRPLTRSRRTWAVALRLNEQALARGSAASPQAKTRPAGKRGIRREWAWQAVMLQDDTCRGKDKPEPLLAQVSGRARMRRPSIEAQECIGALRARERGCPLASRAKGVTGASASVMGLAGTGRARHQRSSCSSGQQQLPQAVNRRSLGSGGLHGFHASTSHSGPPDEAQSARLAQLVEDRPTGTGVGTHAHPFGTRPFAVPVDRQGCVTGFRHVRAETVVRSPKHSINIDHTSLRVYLRIRTLE